MKTRLVIVLILLTIVLVTGRCAYKTPESPAPASDNPGSASDPDTEARLVDRTWISPAMVQVGNYYPGAKAEWNIRIHNGKDRMANFIISYREPNSTKSGYSMPSFEAQDWVIIADPTPVLAPKETREVLIALAIPKETKVVIAPKWEFWISVVEGGQGQVQTEMCSRWLVSMR